MPRDVDAIALFFIVLTMLVTGYFVDHGPMCLANGMRVGVVDEHNFAVIAPRLPAPPSPPALPELPQLPRF